MTKQILTMAAALVFTALAPAQSHAQQITQAKRSLRVSSWEHNDASRRISDPASASVEQTSTADSTCGFVCLNVRIHEHHGEPGQECCNQN